MITIQTNFGDIKVTLFDDKAPKSVKNFLAYVDSGFYDGLIFHRVIKNFMIQGGGFDKDMNRKLPNEPIQCEADNGLSNKTGTLAMARTMDPHSATSQFFINVEDNDFLDFKSQTQQGWGYAVFGEVTDGMTVVNQIKAVETGFASGMQDVPIEPVEIIKITRD